MAGCNLNGLEEAWYASSLLKEEGGKPSYDEEPFNHG